MFGNRTDSKESWGRHLLGNRKFCRMGYGLGHAEWIACHLAEAKHKKFTLANRSSFLSEFHLQSIADCKSIYDRLQHFAAPGSIGDKRVAI